MMPPLRSFDDLDGKERGQNKTDDLRAMTTLGPRTLFYWTLLGLLLDSIRLHTIKSQFLILYIEGPHFIISRKDCISFSGDRFCLSK